MTKLLIIAHSIVFPSVYWYWYYRTRTKFRGLNFCLKISNYFRGSLFLWGVNFRGRAQYFVLKDAIKYCARVTNLSSSIHATKEGRQHTSSPGCLVLIYE